MQFIRWLFGATEDTNPIESSPTFSHQEVDRWPEREIICQKEQLLVVSLRMPPGSHNAPLRIRQEEKLHLMDERVVERNITWGDRVALGSVERGSTLILTLTDGSLVEISFPPVIDSKDQRISTQGEGAYPVPGPGRRQCLIRWEAEPLAIAPRLDEVSCDRRTLYKIMTIFLLPLLYFSMCLYCLYKLGLFGASTVDSLGPTPSEFSYLILPVTLLIGMFIALKAFCSGIKTRVKGCAARLSSWRGKDKQVVPAWMESLIWTVDFIDISCEEFKSPDESESGLRDRPSAQDGFEGDRGWSQSVHPPSQVRIHSLRQVLPTHREEIELEEAGDEPFEVKEGPGKSDFVMEIKDTKMKPSGSIFKHQDAEQDPEGVLLDSPDDGLSDVKLSKDADLLPVDGYEPLPPTGMSFSEYAKKVHVARWGSWTLPELSYFQVRGKNYLQDKVKVPSGPWLLDLLYADLLAAKETYTHISSRPDSFVQRAIRAGIHTPTSPPMFVVNFLMPGYHMILNLVRNEHGGGEAGALFDRFFQESTAPEYRDSSLKFIPRIVEGSWIVSRSVGATPAIIGRKLTQTYYQSKEHNYLEVCIDVTSSRVGANILGVIKGFCTGIIIDLCFLIEGKTPEELPEQLLGGVRVIHGDFSKTYCIPTYEPAIAKDR